MSICLLILLYCCLLCFNGCALYIGFGLCVVAVTWRGKDLVDMLERWYIVNEVHYYYYY